MRLSAAFILALSFGLTSVVAIPTPISKPDYQALVSRLTRRDLDTLHLLLRRTEPNGAQAHDLLGSQDGVANPAVPTQATHATHAKTLTMAGGQGLNPSFDSEAQSDAANSAVATHGKTSAVVEHGGHGRDSPESQGNPPGSTHGKTSTVAEYGGKGHKPSFHTEGQGIAAEAVVTQPSHGSQNAPDDDDDDDYRLRGSRFGPRFTQGGPGQSQYYFYPEKAPRRG